jgi:hypothetical protein
MEKVALKILNLKDITHLVYNYINIENISILILVCKNNMEKVALKLLEFDDINYN